MEINQGFYPAYLLASVAIGALLGLFYDGIRVLRLMRHSRSPRCPIAEYVLLFAEDIAFSVVAAVLFSLLGYAMNRGRIRWFAFVGAAGGWLLYRATLSRAVMALAELVQKLLARLWRATGLRLLSAWQIHALKRKRKRNTARVLANLIREVEAGRWRNEKEKYREENE